MLFKSKEKTERKRRHVPPSFIAAGVKIDGDLTSEGDIDLAGTVEGNVTAAKLTVCAGAAVNGTARAETAIINGTLNGKLAAAEVAFGKAAKVGADVTYVSLRIDEGAVFVGQSRRVESLEALPLDLRQLPAPLAGPVEKRVFDQLPRKIGALLVAAAISFPFGAAAETLPFPPDNYRVVLSIMAALASPQLAAPVRERVSATCDAPCAGPQARAEQDKAKDAAR
jgi:cytoskeletal protein CcmA (bactofilin family)